ncbi:AraC family transcriptional regulator [Acinetobacter silvestris]|uniref:AraC family transcriptional regulator n=1 Tax=Acinetobacter silvestris TaxID=1977882 RepID=A0A1Y3CKF6_9GAMM|nr:AraC family transcriptional regulator [Acinetobacter silvestris]OTG67609.1 AraC family transcriptional regulator [Acinetobacter silvestris]
MQQLKDYTGTVYGGLGHLLYAYSQTKGLLISERLKQVQNLERFDFSIWRELLNEIALQVSSPALGLEIAEFVQPKHLGIIAYIAQSCDTLGEALARYYDFHRLIYDGSPLKVELSEKYLAIRWDELPAHLTTQVTDEIALALMVQFLKQFLEFEHIVIHEVNFTHALAKNLNFYERYFQCKVRFKQPKVELIFPINFLSTPIKHADQTLQSLLKQQAQALLEKLPHSTQLDERLQQSILKGLQRNNYQIEDIATQLNMSVRQLQRHLQSQNTTYQQRIQQVRQILATQYLQDPHLSLHEIALLLSYSEQSAFQRAFKNWMGITPQQWRQKTNK